MLQLGTIVLTVAGRLIIVCGMAICNVRGVEKKINKKKIKRIGKCHGFVFQKKLNVSIF